MGPSTIHGTRRVSCSPGIVFPQPRPLTSPRCSRSSPFGQTHLQFHPSVSADTHTGVSLEVKMFLQLPLCLWLGLFPPPPRILPSRAFFTLKAGAQYPCLSTCPPLRGWESLCMCLTLFPACSPPLAARKSPALSSQQLSLAGSFPIESWCCCPLRRIPPRLPMAP